VNATLAHIHLPRDSAQRKTSLSETFNLTVVADHFGAATHATGLASVSIQIVRSDNLTLHCDQRENSQDGIFESGRALLTVGRVRDDSWWQGDFAPGIVFFLILWRLKKMNLIERHSIGFAPVRRGTI
jgi:hypothetical protein